MTIEVWSIDRVDRNCQDGQTNADGRVDSPLLSGEEMVAGSYELVFLVGDYFGERKFLDRVPVRFTISDAIGQISCAAAGFTMELQHLSRQLR